MTENIGILRKIWNIQQKEKKVICLMKKKKTKAHAIYLEFIYEKVSRSNR